MLRKISAVTFLTFTLASAAFAQSEEPAVYDSQQLGINFSTLGGPGIYYLLPTSAKDNIKFSGIFMYYNEGSVKESFFSVGAEYQYDLLQDENKRGYFTTGAHIDNDLSSDLYLDGSRNREGTFNIGVGLGFDFGSTKKGLILNGHLTYQFTTSLTAGDQTRIGLGGGVGLGFNF